MDPKKSEVIQNWPTPKHITELRVILGITHIFKRFIKTFSSNSISLTNLTKKNMESNLGTRHAMTHSSNKRMY